MRIRPCGRTAPALIGEALALEGQAETSRELAEQGGVGLMTPEATTEAASIKKSKLAAYGRHKQS